MSTKQLIKFERMDEPNIYGYVAQREDGINIEVVQCYENAWNVFMTADGHVVARSVNEYRQCGNNYLTRFDAFKVARELIQGY